MRAILYSLVRTVVPETCSDYLKTAGKESPVFSSGDFFQGRPSKLPGGMQIRTGLQDTVSAIAKYRIRPIELLSDDLHTGA